MRARAVAATAAAIAAVTCVSALGMAAPAQAKDVSFDTFIASGNARFERLMKSPVKYTLAMTTKDGSDTSTMRMSGAANPDGSGYLTLDIDGKSATMRCTATTCAKRESGQSAWVTGPNNKETSQALNLFLALKSGATAPDLAKATFDITGGRYTADIEGGPATVVFTGSGMTANLATTQPTGVVLDLKTSVKRTAPFTVKLPS